METPISLMGDAHLGRNFIHGVALSRRCEREDMVWRDFAANLAAAKPGFHVTMGDLFDKAIVPYEVIVRAAELYWKAAEAKPQTRFVILRGNHDARRDLERISAFDLFGLLVRDIPTIFVVSGPCLNLDEHQFYGWDPVVTAKELARRHARQCRAAFGHWDVDGNDHSLIPLAELAAGGVASVYTGHVHKPQRFRRNGIEVTVVGSLQPFAHGEECDERLYLTRSLAEVKADPSLYHDKCLRIDLQPGEMLDAEIDCLQLTLRRLGEELVSQEKVTLGEFDLMKLFTRAFDEEQVPDPIRTLILDRYQESRC